MKKVGKLLALLGGLSALMVGAPLEERLARVPARRSSAVSAKSAQTQVPGQVHVPRWSSPAAATTAPRRPRPSPASLPFNDTGDTNGKSDNSTGFSTRACNDPLTGFTRPGPDVIYSFTIVGFGNSLTFTVTPVAPDADYDTAIYVVASVFAAGHLRKRGGYCWRRRRRDTDSREPGPGNLLLRGGFVG